METRQAAFYEKRALEVASPESYVSSRIFIVDNPVRSGIIANLSKLSVTRQARKLERHLKRRGDPPCSLRVGGVFLSVMMAPTLKN